LRIKTVKKTKEIEIRIRIRKVYFRMLYETKKTFEIFEISSIRNVVNTLFSTDDIFYTQQRNFKTLIGGGGGTTVHPSTPTPSLLPVGCLRHFVYSKFRIFRMFFFVSYTIRKYTFRIRIRISISTYVK